MFRLKMKPIRKWQASEDEKAKRQIDILVGKNKITEAQNMSIAAMIEILKDKTTKSVILATEQSISF